MLERFERFSTSVISIYNAIQKIEADEVQKYGLRGAHAQYLIAMTHHPDGITAAKLGESLGRDKAAVSRAVCQMEEMGLIRRGNEKNAYRASLHLTEKGETAARALCERAVLAVETAGSGLTDEIREAFYTALSIISESLLSISRDGLPEKNEQSGDTYP